MPLAILKRRGIAFRDEFDTSFDDVLFLETPDIEYDLALLRRRIIGMPLPFAYYCYTVSGGLPRDLIRVCRDVYDIAKNYNDATLPKIVAESAIIDLRSKMRAISIAATEFLVEPEAHYLFNGLNDVVLESPDTKNWKLVSNRLLEKIGSVNELDEKLNKMKMIKLIDEFATYLLFSSTIVEYFSNMGKQNVIRELSTKEISAIENLARAKQLITSSSTYSRSVIKHFRKQVKLA